MRDVLKLATYRRLLVAYTLNELAWTFGPLALSVLVYRRTGSVIGAGAYFLCSQFVPALLGPALVARVDQRPPGSVLPVLFGLEGAAYLGLALLASSFSLAPILVLTVADGILAMAARPITRTATFAVTSPAGLLREGNALTNTAASVCYMAGPAIGGLVVVAGGAGAALFTNSLIFALIALVLARAQALRHRPPKPSQTAGRLRAALSYARSHPPVFVLLALQGTAVLFFTISMPVEVVFASHTLHAGAGGYGALLSAWGIGAVAGSAAYVRWRRVDSRTLIALGSSSIGLGFVVMAAAPSLAVALVGAALGGVANGVEAVAARTALQERTALDWMAMVMSLSDALLQGVPGAGILLGVAVTALSGPRTALAVAGAGAFVVALTARAIVAPDAPAATGETSLSSPQHTGAEASAAHAARR